MKKEIAEKWVKALREGGYIQGRNDLRHQEIEGNIVYCCLGVLADISGLGEWDYYGYKTPGCVSSGSVLGKTLLDWSGLARISGAKLADLNDKGSSFEDIANKIENEWEEL